MANLKQKYFLEKLDKATQDDCGFEKSLYLLLRDNEEKIYIPDNEPEYLHKSFRQVDVTGSWKVDMAIYFLMQDSKIIWKVMEEVYENLQ